jgi:hypothetical protein
MNQATSMNNQDIINLIDQRLPHTVSRLVIRNLYMLWSNITPKTIRDSKESLRPQKSRFYRANGVVGNYALYRKLDHKNLLRSLVKECFGLKRYSRKESCQQMIDKLMKA